MPTNNLLDFSAPYVQERQVQERRLSALVATNQVLRLPDLTEKHRREFLTIALWKWTEAPGSSPHPKYNLRYVSEGVLDQNVRDSINHEHVFTRKSIIDELLRRTEWPIRELEELLRARGVACIVTVTEHARLGNAGGTGWKRYANADVRVWDRQLSRWFDLNHRNSGLAETTEPGQGFSVGSCLIDVTAAIQQNAPNRERLFRRFLRTARFASAVGVVGGSATSRRVGDYVRVHDSLVEEPTPAVAYLHWSGRLTLRLQSPDVPAELLGAAGVAPVLDSRYGVRAFITDDSSLEVAEELLLLALEKLREEVAG